MKKLFSVSLIPSLFLTSAPSTLFSSCTKLDNLEMASEVSASSSSIKMTRCSFQFEVDYLKTKDLPIGQCICSPTFTAGGYDWALKYYPQGQGSSYLDNQGSHISLYLCFKSDAKNIITWFAFQLLDNTQKSIVQNQTTHSFSRYDEFWGYPNFIARKAIDNFNQVNGVINICCNIRVLTKHRVVKNYPGGLCEHIVKLWEKKKSFDVTFEVEGENISAHRLILAARSPVFDASLFGPMVEGKMEHIRIDEMKAEVFMALLHFVYTDELTLDEPGSDQTHLVEILHSLLMAADRYALHKLTFLCVEKLLSNLSVETVAATLLLADRHGQTDLKNGCLKFASDPKNFSLFALTEGYVHIIQVAPSLFAELSKLVKGSSAKKQRTS